MFIEEDRCEGLELSLAVTDFILDQKLFMLFLLLVSKLKGPFQVLKQGKILFKTEL